MTTLLQLNTSLQSEAGQSSRLAQRFVDTWHAAHPDTRVVRRDLAADPIPHLTAERFGAFVTAPEQRTPAQQAEVRLSDELIAELRSSDLLVIGLPMYNFGVPSQLKAYFDHVARAGVTFRYTETGPVGLLQGKPAYVFATRGGLYAGTELDTQTQYVRQFLQFLGIGPVQFVYAEGLAMGSERRAAGLEQAEAAIGGLAA